MSMDMFELALATEGVTGKLADVARSIYMQESGQGKNTKTSNAGATGGMQIIPSTFASVADKGWDINDPMQNARAGIRYLQQMYGKAGGDAALTAAGYYGGPGGMDKARKGIAVSDPRNPNAPNTLQYASQVVGRVPNQGMARAPVQLAQAAPVQQMQRVQQAPVQQVVQTPQGAVPVGYAAPKEEWKQFQQAMPDPVTPTSMNFGNVSKKFDPLAYGPQNANVDFRSFIGKRGRA